MDAAPQNQKTTENQDKIPVKNPEPLIKSVQKPAAQTDEFLFFNVMPKNTGAQGELVQPLIKVQQAQSQQSASPGKLSSMLKKYRLHILIGVVVLVLGAVSYFVFTKLAVEKSEDLLNSNTGLHPVGEKPSSEPGAALSYTDWLKKYFNEAVCSNPGVCGDNADPDHDGLTNKEEFTLGADPNNADSDQDGLADGDEAHIFGSNPLNAHSGKDQKYTDSDYAKGAYDFRTDQKYSETQLLELTNKMKEFGVHSPTIVSLKDVLLGIYNLTDWNIIAPPVATSTASSTLQSVATTTPASGSPLEGLDVSVDAQQSRDAQRSAAISSIGMALLKYNQDSKAYPKAATFTEMFNTVKPYLKVATRAEDPVNKQPYIYTYQVSSDGKDFTLSFYSEVAGQIIKKHAADALREQNDQQAGIYDDQRKTDLEMIKTALLLYSNKNVAGNQDYVFPPQDKYKIDLVPNYIDQIPTDPKTGEDFEYQVSETFDTFTLKAILDAPPKGKTGYLCNQEECRNY